MCGLPKLRVCAACPTYCECVQPVQLTADVCSLPNLLRVCSLPNLFSVCAACPTYCECAARPNYCVCGLPNSLCVRPAQLTTSVCSLPHLLQCVQPAQLTVSVCGLPNLLRVCAACPTYCECVRPAQLIASVCGLPNSPLTLKFELRPSWNNIHDTFPTGTKQATSIYNIKWLVFTTESECLLRGTSCIFRYNSRCGTQSAVPYPALRHTAGSSTARGSHTPALQLGARPGHAAPNVT